MRLIAVVDSIGNTQGTAHCGLRAAHRTGFRDVLASFALPREKLIAIIYEANRLGIRVFLDSGAFSAFTRGLRIDVAEYIDFCLSTRSLLEDIACLDVIGDPAATHRNYETMRKAGLEPLPTFHFGMEPRELVARLQDIERAALGGMATKERSGREMRQRWLDTVFNGLMKSSAWPIRLHGYGMTDTVLIERYPWYSVDSTTWAMSAVYGNELVYSGRHLVQRSSEIHPQRGSVARVARAARSGQRIADFGDYCTRLWEKRGIVWD